jgi:hypothetical protein
VLAAGNKHNAAVKAAAASISLLTTKTLLGALSFRAWRAPAKDAYLALLGALGGLVGLALASSSGGAG